MLQAYIHLFIFLCASIVQAGPLILPRNANGTHILPAYGTAKSLSQANAQPAYASTTSPCTTVSDSSTTYTAPVSPPSFGMGSFPTVVDWSSLTVAHPSSGKETSTLLHFTYAPLRPTDVRSTAAATYYNTKPCTDSSQSYDSTSTKTTFITRYTTVQPSHYSQNGPGEEAPQSTNTADSQQSKGPATTSAPSSQTTSFVFFGEQPTTSAAPNPAASAKTFTVPYANTKPTSTSCSTSTSQPPPTNANPSTSHQKTRTFIYAPRPTTSDAQTSQSTTTAPDTAEATELPAIVTQQPSTSTTSSQPVGITIIPVNPYNLNPLPSSKKDSHQQQQDENGRATVTVTVTDAGATKTVNVQGSDCTDT